MRADLRHFGFAFLKWTLFFGLVAGILFHMQYLTEISIWPPRPGAITEADWFRVVVVKAATFGAVGGAIVAALAVVWTKRLTRFHDWWHQGRPT